MSRRLCRYAMVVGLGTGLLLSAGCTQGLTRQQKAWLADGRRQFDRKDYPHAISTLSRFLSDVKTGPGVAEALYVRGMCHAQSDDRSAAYADLRRAAELAADKNMRWRTNAVLGTLHYEDRHWADAARRLNAAVADMPPRPPRDAVLFRLGLCYERMGRWDAARACHQELAVSFPDSSFTSNVRRRLHENARHYAVQCGAFRTRSNADRRQGELRRKGLDAYVQRVVRGQTPLYLVLVGRYSNYDDALSAHKTIKRDFVPDAVLWP